VIFILFCYTKSDSSQLNENVDTMKKDQRTRFADLAIGFQKITIKFFKKLDYLQFKNSSSKKENLFHITRIWGN